MADTTAASDSAHPARLAPVDEVVVPVEGSGHDLDVQAWAVHFAAAVGAPVRALHVATGPEEPPGDIFQMVERMAAEQDLPLESVVLHDTDVADALLRDLDVRDLVIVGTRLMGTAWHVGSVTEALVRRAPCPVQVIRLGGAGAVEPLGEPAPYSDVLDEEES